MACRDIARKRRRNLERFHQRTAERRAAGLCVKCGKTEPAPDRSLCKPCLEKRRAADRARTARLGPKGNPGAIRNAPGAMSASAAAAARRAQGRRDLHQVRPARRPERTLCEPCAERHRVRDRARHAKAKARGIPYGGRDPETKRRADRERSRHQRIDRAIV